MNSAEDEIIIFQTVAVDGAGDPELCLSCDVIDLGCLVPLLLAVIKIDLSYSLPFVLFLCTLFFFLSHQQPVPADDCPWCN